jgi:putative thioredoxin
VGRAGCSVRSSSASPRISTARCGSPRSTPRPTPSWPAASPSAASRRASCSSAATCGAVGGSAPKFVGALPESAVRDFVGRHIKSELEAELERIASLRAAGDLEPAAAAIDAVLADHADHPGALVEAARVALARGEADLAAERAAAVSIAADEHDLARALVTAAELSRAATGGDDPYTTGARQATAGQWRDALESFLEIARTDPRAREAMLAVFVLCDDDELARTYRRKLAIVT